MEPLLLSMIGEWREEEGETSFHFFPGPLTVKLRPSCSVRDEAVRNPLSINWHLEAVLIMDDDVMGGVAREASVRIGYTPEIPDRLLLQTTLERCPKREFEHLFGLSPGEFTEGRCISVKSDSLLMIHNYE